MQINKRSSIRTQNEIKVHISMRLPFLSDFGFIISIANFINVLSVRTYAKRRQNFALWKFLVKNIPFLPFLNL